MEMAKEIFTTTCIMCPMGCSVQVTKEGEDYKAIGQNCFRGKTYAISEMQAPQRVVTSTIKYLKSVTSVKTASAVPKEKIEEVLAEIKALDVQTPLKNGDVVIKNVAGTNVDVVVTGNI